MKIVVIFNFFFRKLKKIWKDNKKLSYVCVSIVYYVCFLNPTIDHKS